MGCNNVWVNLFQMYAKGLQKLDLNNDYTGWLALNKNQKFTEQIFLVILSQYLKLRQTTSNPYII